MQDCGDADLGAEVLGVGGNGQHGVGGSLEQETVDLCLVLVSNGSNLGWEREDDVKVGDLQQLGLALLHPCKCLTALTLWAVAVPATAVRDYGVGALVVLAARDIAAECRGAAGLDGTHHLNCAWLTWPRLASRQ